MRVERTATRRRALWPPLRRRRDVAITLSLRTIDDLFETPKLDPFAPDYERYGDKPGIDAITSVLLVERPVAHVRATVEVPSEVFDSSLEQRMTDAVRRYCRVKIADLGQELRQIRRYGAWALALGLVAVFVLNAIANPLDATEDDVLQLISTGLQVAAWVTLWFPINLLVYDRWYARRDQSIYRDLLNMKIAVVPAGRPLARPDDPARDPFAR